ncbi:anti-sigma-V factor RsiV [Vallitalea longa]|uniref:Anti-sigma-V factor RsiV n=1 Tax=Vallitalea longa TaxID=2936439 RepID=A0A9W5YBU4_9FIRM|nr:DUF3298 and DUF4163 domain-containing protein [Vallitalea longa]GKX30239.1 anti-sigma-V factor RsiV [Vallitalea longa]
MENKLYKMKQEYENITIPKELNDIVEKTIEETTRKVIRREMIFNRGFKAVGATFLICILFIFVLNTNKTLAKTISNLPIIGRVARVLTFVDYKYENDSITENVVIPRVDGLNDVDLQDKINTEIKNKMDEQIKEAEKRAEEYKEAYFETGGTQENYKPIKFEIDYEKKYNDESILSFIIYHNETLAPAYSGSYYYNIDLTTDKEMTLEDVLGKDYMTRANESIEKQIKKLLENPPKDRHYGFFKGESGFKSIKEDQGFFINSNQKVVIVFDKYEIADGATGKLEFIID